ncbi:MAG: MFS transporter [Acidobacteriota bacterium]|nr:MFS transporter [Acidobacteriota bacterium]
MDETGWRKAYLGLAGVCLATAVPVVGIFLRGGPAEVGLRPDGADSSVTPAPRVAPAAGMNVAEALRTRTLWQLCGIFFCVAACVNGAIAHLVPLLTDRGVSGSSAPLATSLFGAATIAGRVGNGYLVDRFGETRPADIFSPPALIPPDRIGCRLLSHLPRWCSRSSRHSGSESTADSSRPERRNQPYLIARSSN